MCRDRDMPRQRNDIIKDQGGITEWSDAGQPYKNQYYPHFGSNSRRCKGYGSESRDRNQDTAIMAAEECPREPRKRRERRDSGNTHERKERRPHSEERPTPPATPILNDYNRLEVERRAERLSRARRPQYGGKRRRGALRVPPPPKDYESFARADETIRCSTPPLDIQLIYKHHYREQQLDLGALHRQLCGDGEEPARSVAAQRPPPPPANNAVHTPRPLSPRTDTEKRLEKIKKKITILNKSIADHESAFEAKNGWPMTQSDRITDVQLTRMYDNLRKLQIEKRCIKSDPAEYLLKVKAAKQQKERDDKLEECLKSDKPMSDLVMDIEEWLEGCRLAGGRIGSGESWSAAQLVAEKGSVQRALLRLEAARGRPPAHSADRGAARHLYDQYRNVKRALATMRPDAIITELATIHEHEAMLFNTSIDSSSEEREKNSLETQQETTETPVESPAGRSSDEVPSSTSSTPTITEDGNRQESLHCLTIPELQKLLNNAKLQKSILRHSIKEYEVGFDTQNSIKLQRDDKKINEEEYLRYKAIKARIKLLNALINKKSVTA